MTTSDLRELLSASHELVEAGDYKTAMPLLEIVLDEDPNNAPALNMQGYIAIRLHQDTVAYQYLRRAIQCDPQRAAVWVNFALAAQHLGRMEESLACCHKAIEIDPEYALGYTNACAALVGMSRWQEAGEMARKALSLNPRDRNAACNLAHVHLAAHEWVEGWKYWEMSLGTDQRKEWSYGDEPRWDGSKGKHLVVYGEQGLGDEIMYASCLSDAIGDSEHVIIDCDPRLETLFRRSFPTAEVYGTRRDDSPHWLADATIDARVSTATLPTFYRRSDSDFPGEAFLKPDPEKVLMWKALWKSLGKPVIGICSQGGAKYTNKRGRSIPVEAFESLFEQDAIFISLDYRDGIEHPELRQYAAARADDYDDTAALIASLDRVVGVSTTAIHCANALGVPTDVLVPTWHQWRYAGAYVWSKSAKLHHQSGREWEEVIEECTATSLSL